jgi:lipopolysaccharide export system protein LptC
VAAVSVKRYTRWVSFARSSLWMLIVFVVGMVVWLASDNTSDNGMRVAFTQMQKSAENLQNIMLKPHYQGVDARNQPFTVIAETATQLDSDNVVLDKVRGDMVMGDGAWMAVNAGNGKLNINSKILELREKVNIFYEGGYEFRSDYAHVDIQKGNAYGNMPVEGQGPPGTLTADSFEVVERGRIIRFSGSVKMKLYR